MAEVDRLTGKVAGLASRGRSRWWSSTPAAGLAVDQVIRLLGEFHKTMEHSSADP
jgi:hypothetical protein